MKCPINAVAHAQIVLKLKFQAGPSSAHLSLELKPLLKHKTDIFWTYIVWIYMYWEIVI